VFQDGENQYLSRAWMIEPVETDEVAENAGKKGIWNGEFYCTLVLVKAAVIGKMRWYTDLSLQAEGAGTVKPYLC
jgi:hypothetical protein